MPYAWSGIELPQEPLGWMHSGVAVTDEGVVVTHPAEPTLLVYRGGEVVRSFTVDGLLEPHGFLVDGDAMWICDVGFKRRVRGGDFETERGRGRVVRVDRTGAILSELHDPADGWSPTALAVAGDVVFVADGYGRSLVHRFDRDGEHLETLSGEEGAGRFDCPHGVLAVRGGEELLVSDRANGRIQVYGANGAYRRTIGERVVVTPTDMVDLGDRIALTDFTIAQVTIVDLDGRLVEVVGANAAAPARDGWPNARTASGDLVRPQLEPGLFNSPHTIAADAGGNLYVTEWLLGGRLTMLSPS
ncbi:MAG TPA: hypothetical protein VI408_13060 [Gaiellaceae bacterium]